MMAFTDFLSPLLLPLLQGTGAFWTIIIVSFFVSLLTTIVYKYTTNQKKLRKLKADLKRHQKKARQLAKEDPTSALEAQKEMMRLNGQYMKSSLRSTLYTFIPVILFFGWLSAFLAFAPLAPGDAFTVSVDLVPDTSGNLTLDVSDAFLVAQNKTLPVINQSVTWRLRTESSGNYSIALIHSSGEEFRVPVQITGEYASLTPVVPINGVVLQQVRIGYTELDIFEGVFFFGDIPWVKTWGWLGAYILFSLIFSTALRRVLKLA